MLRRGLLEMDTDRHLVKVDGVEVSLTPVEFRLLQALLESPERAFTREQLLNQIYAHHEAVAVDRTIDVHVGKVRQKLGDDPDHPRFIATVRGVGYKLL
jgi:DNA-binding response OmpR family regulator